LGEYAQLVAQARRILGDVEDWGAMSKEEGWYVVVVSGEGSEAILPLGTSHWQGMMSGWGRHGCMT